MLKIAWGAIRLRNWKGALTHDLLMIPVAWLGALWLRFNLDSIPADQLDQALRLIPVIVVIQGSCFLYFGLYRGVWRFASLPDLVRIVQAVAVGVTVCAFVTFLMTRMVHIPRASFPLFAVILTVLLSGPRLVYRWIRQRGFGATDMKTILIVGAGTTGEKLARSLLYEPLRGYRPIGFVDDDPRKKGSEIHGIRVLGHCGQIPRIARHTSADLVAIAIPSANQAQIRRIMECSERSNLPVQLVSHSKSSASGSITLDGLRDVSIEDLLNRETAWINWPGMRDVLTAHTILVTGGGGSIGSELCRQIARLEPSRLVAMDVSEFNLYRLELELREAYPALALSIVLADVCDAAAVERVFKRHRPAVVFHTAAYKHVPMLEDNVREAVRVNALGTYTAACAAKRHAADRFVLISSDKAVNPANAMGASKRLAEKICHAACHVSPSTRFMAVRFGNVLDSTGSVVPLFREQISRGGPVTVTDRDMERYFMTIPEASQLVMASAVLGDGGETFVLDMGEPMRIVHLAEQMIRLSGKTPGEDIAIEFIGSRPGEKLSEELFRPAEPCSPTRHEKILLVHQQPFDHAGLTARIAELRAACEAFDESALERILFELVPEYLHETSPPVEGVIPFTRAKPRRRA